MATSAEVIADLIERARVARANAYAPYSNYEVGAAILTGSGQVFSGANVENASYPTTMCAERSAVFAAVGQGQRSFEAIVVMSENGGAPCGACRQVLSEFGLDLRVVSVDSQGKVHLESSLEQLMPNAFGPEDLVLP